MKSETIKPNLPKHFDWIVAGITFFPILVIHPILTYSDQLKGYGIVNLIHWTPRDNWQAAIALAIPIAAFASTLVALKFRPEMRGTREFFLRLIVGSMTIYWCALCFMDYSRYNTYGKDYPGYEYHKQR